MHFLFVKTFTFQLNILSMFLLCIKIKRIFFLEFFLYMKTAVAQMQLLYAQQPFGHT